MGGGRRSRRSRARGDLQDAQSVDSVAPQWSGGVPGPVPAVPPQAVTPPTPYIAESLSRDHPLAAVAKVSVGPAGELSGQEAARQSIAQAALSAAATGSDPEQALQKLLYLEEKTAFLRSFVISAMRQGHLDRMDRDFAWNYAREIHAASRDAYETLGIVGKDDWLAITDISVVRAQTTLGESLGVGGMPQGLATSLSAQPGGLARLGIVAVPPLRAHVFVAASFLDWFDIDWKKFWEGVYARLGNLDEWLLDKLISALGLDLVLDLLDGEVLDDLMKAAEEAADAVEDAVEDMTEENVDKAAKAIKKLAKKAAKAAGKGAKAVPKAFLLSFIMELLGQILEMLWDYFTGKPIK